MLNNFPFPVFFLNDRLVPANEALISPLDRGFLFADSVYEVMLVQDGHVCNLNRHLARLKASLQALSIPAVADAETWLQRVQGLIDANGATDAALYLQISRGVGPSRSLLWDEPLQPTLFMFLDQLPYAHNSDAGLRAATAEDLRWHKCDIKATGLTANMLMRRGDSSVDEVIMHRSGEVTEGTSSNVFAVLEGTVITPTISSQILPGITRALILEVLSETDTPCEERLLRLDELRRAEEIWVSSILRGISPVVSLDNSSVGEGIAGDLWKALQQQIHHKRIQVANSPH